ncbi:SIP domain-containing protein [Corynebacterium variabile]|uniref:Siderophore-interacting protein n=3 Tax=Corynebacterium variabile TaxID=1727 RepID=G0HAB0_CORVD|nr:siderophore-interacting protein [Corynebacterium variabile]AEK36126.1 Siderophore-interacting protein [Corynebacterium variabile DSM 44702]
MPRRARPTIVRPIALRELEVKRVADITPGLRRVTLTGDELGALTTPEGFDQLEFTSTGFDDDIKLIFAYPGETEPVLPIRKEGGIRFPKERRPLGKSYTVRRWDAATRELDVDFVKHGLGTATTWAYRAQPGERIHIAGPTTSTGLPEGADWLLIAGDDTATPAIARFLEDLPADTRGKVFIEVAEDAHIYDLREIPNMEVTWLPRNGAPAGASTLLLDAVAAASWQDGQCFAWLAGEQSVVRDLRRHLIDIRSLDKAWIDFTGYWKRETVESIEGDDAVPDADNHETAFERFHEMAEILPPLAIRAAANLGLGDLLNRGTTTVAGLVEATGADERALRKFLRYLEGLELVEPVGSTGADSATGDYRPEEYRLSESGVYLTHEDVLEYVLADGLMARQELAFRGIEQAVRTGRPVYQEVTGHAYTELQADPTFSDRTLENTARVASFMAGPLASSESLAAGTGPQRIVVHSRGANGLAAEFVAAFPAAQVEIVALPAQAAWFRADLPAAVADAAARDRISIVEQSLFEETAPADTILFARALTEIADADAALALRKAASSLSEGGRILLLEDTQDIDHAEGPDEHDAEADLLNLTLTGGGFRTVTELEQVIADAGLKVTAAEVVGWGSVLRTLGRA